MKLPCIFSSGALYQAGSTLTVRGTADTADLPASATLSDTNGYEVARSDGKTGNDGRFFLPLNTPAASFDTYTLTVTCGDERQVMSDVMFGELWLASGQSNMELGNGAIPEHDRLYDRLAGKHIRVFSVDYWKLEELASDPPFPYDPQPMMGGHWLTADDRQDLDGVSAAATACCLGIYDKLNETADIPVGFLNAAWGGTPLLAFLNREDIEADSVFADKLRRVGRYPCADTWNGPDRGCCCFQQTCACWNVKIAPLEGVRVRGVLWYQGENETGCEPLAVNYADSLRFYQETYRARFAADPDRFPVISSLLYLWKYGPEGECYIGQLNDAFTKTAAGEPDKFMCVPIGDLEPSWAQHLLNHPIHPTHKYPLGARMADVALANVYGFGEKVRPTVLSQVETSGNVLRLTFTDCGNGLRIGNGPYRAPAASDGFRPVHCLYMAGRDGRYLPAEARVVSSDTLDVRCEGVDAPVYVAYCRQSMEPGADLFAGTLPVSPFCNDTRREMRIEQKPWYDMNNVYQWADKVADDVRLNLFFHPVWRPVGDSEVCPDTAFCFETDKSLRICGDDVPPDGTFGAFVTSYPYATLDFDGYKALEASLFNTADTRVVLRLETADGSFVDCPFIPVSDLGAGWKRMRAALDSKPDGEIRRMIFLFSTEKDTYRFVNMERIRLVPAD